MNNVVVNSYQLKISSGTWKAFRTYLNLIPIGPDKTNPHAHHFVLTLEKSQRYPRVHFIRYKVRGGEKMISFHIDREMHLTEKNHVPLLGLIYQTLRDLNDQYRNLAVINQGRERKILNYVRTNEDNNL